MVQLVEKQDEGSGFTRKDTSPGNSIPKRTHTHTRRASTPAQLTIRDHTLRLMVVTAIGIVVMYALLMLAVKYANHDWSKKNQRAWTSSASKPSPAASNALAVEVASPEGWKYELSPAATQRQMARLAGDRSVPNQWLILARGLSDKTDSAIIFSCLRMAMAHGGENAAMKNDLGAVYFQQKRIQEALAAFSAADQIRPGFAPTRFNLALCALSDRNPEKAIQLLGQYLGQRPTDTAALRLQSALLVQLGRPQHALRMLEKFLRDQPIDQPLFLEAAMLAARLGQTGNAIRYLETALNGNSIRTVVRAYQSTTFRDIRLSGEGDQLAARMADKARAAFLAPIPEDEIPPQRSLASEAKVR